MADDRRAALRELAQTIAEPVATKLAESDLSDLVERIEFAFRQADTEIIPQHAVSEIADAVVANCRALLSAEDHALVLQRLTGALRGFVASDTH
jgi:cobalamin biosynthesis protein CbiG